MYGILALQRLKLESCWFKTSLGYIVRHFLTATDSSKKFIMVVGREGSVL